MSIATAGLAQPQAPPKVAATETAAFIECIQTVYKKMAASGVTPERFELVINGACIPEADTMATATEAAFMRMGAGTLSYADNKETTDQVMVKWHASLRAYIARLLSDYTASYAIMAASLATASKPDAR
jgi:hypothetical protein